MTLANALPEPAKLYSIAEEVANSLTHGVGALLSVAGLTLLVTLAVLQADIWKVVSFSIYGASLVLLYLASTLYHSFQAPKIKSIFKVMDHCAIYLLIAGTYTPFLLVNMRGAVGWTLFGIVWGIAALGIALKLFFPGRFSKISLLTYLAMGWLIVFASGELVAKVDNGGIWLLVAGGVTYTLGVLFYVVDRIPFNHAIWHLFVLGGSICHFMAVYFYVLPAV